MLMIVTAYCLDLVFGDPQRVLHPVQIMGMGIKKLETLSKKTIFSGHQKAFGMFVNLLLLSTVFIASIFLANLHWLIELYLLYTCLATRSLSNEALKIKNVLLADDITLAQKEIGYLVSRDTKQMDKNQIIRSTIETVAENTVDGVTAPLFYMLLGALISPYLAGATLGFAMLYKAINTFDSMWGYKTAQYIDLGWFSARLDDWANYLPARFTGFILIPTATFLLGFQSRDYAFKNALKIFLRDRLKHASPNSGHPEAAVAGALGVQFGGKTKYFGTWHNKPTIGDKLAEFDLEHIKQSVHILWVTSFLSVCALLFILLVCHLAS